MTVSGRLALVVGLLLLIATATLLLLPTASETLDAGCGNALAPAVNGSDLADARSRAKQLTGDEIPTLDPSSGDLGNMEAGIVVYTAECYNAVQSRRELAIGVGIATLLVPAAIWFVGSGRRRA